MGPGSEAPMRAWLPLLLLSLAATLVSIPPPALASGVNLAWNDCLPAAGSATMMPFDCSDDATTHRLVGSFIPPDGMNDVVGMEATLFLIFPDGPQPDWWMLGAGECREGRITVDLVLAG